jgi:hypothetical protein
MDNAQNSIANRFGNSFHIIEPHLQTALVSAADPERSLVYLARLLDSDREFYATPKMWNSCIIESP